MNNDYEGDYCVTHQKEIYAIEDDERVYLNNNLQLIMSFSSK